MTEPQTIIILGMHRSGTSCLAGCLAQAGLFLGDVNRGATHNKKGNFENRSIRQLHMAVLKENGGSWDSPPRKVVWSEAHKNSLTELLDAYSGNQLWGFKDPRTLIVLDEWLKLFPNAKLVGSFRHPVAVAKSLKVRNDFSYEKGMKLWFYYNRHLKNAVIQRKGLLIDFDVPASQYQRKIINMVEKLELPLTPKGIDFFDPNLRVQREDKKTKMPFKIRRLHKKLTQLAIQ